MTEIPRFWWAKGMNAMFAQGYAGEVFVYNVDEDSDMPTDVVELVTTAERDTARRERDEAKAEVAELRAALEELAARAKQTYPPTSTRSTRTSPTGSTSRWSGRTSCWPPADTTEENRA